MIPKLSKIKMAIQTLSLSVHLLLTNDGINRRFRKLLRRACSRICFSASTSMSMLALPRQKGKETLGSESYGLPYGKATICVVMFNIYVSDRRITIQRKVLLVYHNMKWRCANKYEELNNESHIGAPWECTLISSKALKYIHIKVQIHMSSCKHPQKYA